MRRRGQTLLLVEGNHEKNELFQLIFKSFPELSIKMEDVWIYGTNIYMLYEDIVKEYGNDWDEIDIDLPLLISKKVLEERRYKDEFVNIYLIFDYERHDPNFSSEKIIRMQRYFSDAADNGQLYISYPMIEAYQDLEDFDITHYIDKKVAVSVRPGKEYKRLVRKSFIEEAVSHYSHMYDVLRGHFGITDEDSLERAVNEMFMLKSSEDISDSLVEILKEYVGQNKIYTAANQLKDYISRIGYIVDGFNYWEHMRDIFISIIKVNILKAFGIQENRPNGDLGLRDIYEYLNFETILKIQNSASESEDGFIWILSTCVFLVAEYNFNLLMK